MKGKTFILIILSFRLYELCAVDNENIEKFKGSGRTYGIFKKQLQAGRAKGTFHF